MKTSFLYALLFVCFNIVILTGCSDSGLKESNTDSFKWLIGNRIDTTMEFYENWAGSGDSVLNGNGYQVVDGDTIFEELLSIKRAGNNWSYVVRYGTEETRFTLSNAPGDSLVFENPDNEFPRRITYIKKPDGAFIAIIENPGEPDKTTRFNFVLIK
jgi:hypothetical protein